MKWFRPSQLRSGELCPRFVYNEMRDTTAAEKGTRIHKAIETGSYDSLVEEEKDIAVDCLEYLHSLPPVLEAHHEVRMTRDNVQGTADYVAKVTETGLYRLMDWKTGRLTVDEAKDNVQMQAYVWMAFQEFPDASRFEVHIVAPKGHSSSAIFTREDEKMIHLRLLAIIARLEDAEQKPTPCEEACQWCGGKANCPALTAIAIRQGTLLPVPMSMPEGGPLTPDYRSKLQVLACLLEDWCTQVKRANVKAVVEDGVVIPGFVVRSRRGNAQIMDMVEAARLLREEGLSDTSILNACSISLTKLADIYEAEKGGGKKASRQLLDEKLNSVMAHGESVTWLQREKEQKGNK